MGGNEKAAKKIFYLQQFQVIRKYSKTIISCDTLRLYIGFVETRALRLSYEEHIDDKEEPNKDFFFPG